MDLNSWEYVPDHRGEIVYNTETGDAKESLHRATILKIQPLLPH
ncbi:putative tail fiber chaperone (Assembly protein) e14 prophage (plasmid) [Escherichia coli]|nr:putative tail fiber chaperone (Assembly protein) e14 prophage [Escherichia coli]